MRVEIGMLLSLLWACSNVFSPDRGPWMSYPCHSFRSTPALHIWTFEPWNCTEIIQLRIAYMGVPLWNLTLGFQAKLSNSPHVLIIFVVIDLTFASAGQSTPNALSLSWHSWNAGRSRESNRVAHGYALMDATRDCKTAWCGNEVTIRFKRWSWIWFTPLINRTSGDKPFGRPIDAVPMYVIRPASRGCIKVP